MGISEQLRYGGSDVPVVSKIGATIGRNDRARDHEVEL